jgi:molecular chaperone GrpE
MRGIRSYGEEAMAAEPKRPKLDIPADLAEELDAAAGETPKAQGEASEPGEGVGGSSAVEESLRAELAALQDRLLRMAAEHENQRRRWLREQQDSLNYANENLIKDLLPTVDNLERALEHARQAQGDEGEKKKNLLDGIELTFRSLMGVLERAGVEIVKDRGVEFDPRFHEAMRQVPTAEFAPNTVVDVYQRGYLLKGRLL